MYNKGFTLIELLIVISIIGILSAIVLLAINPAQVIEKANYSSTISNLGQIAKAAQFFEVSAGYLPADTNRDIPTEFMQYLGPGIWPKGPFDNSVYDWDNWTGMTCWDGTEGGIQISLRDIKKYQGQDYSTNTQTITGRPQFTLYYAVVGEGIPHCNDSNTVGICVNCTSTYPP